jgi:acyl carrier protein
MDASERDAAALADVDGFAEALISRLSLDLEGVNGGTRLREDLGIDSLGMLECQEFLATLGAEIPEAMVSEVVTIEDLHHHYLTRLTAGDRANG